jgi:large subunit ribosomal protein L10
MNRTEKGEQIKRLAELAGKAPFILVAEFRGTKVSEVNQFRRDLEKAGMAYKVIKNTLARRAFGEVGVAGLDGKLKGMTGIVFSSDDAIASAKKLKELIPAVPTLQVRAGYFDGAALDANAVKTVAEMPSREDILAKLLATLQEGPRQLVGVVQAPARDLVFVLSNYANKLAAGAAA